jgi:hypothetical protein
MYEKIEPVHATTESSSELDMVSLEPCEAAACVVLDTTGKASDDELVKQLGKEPQLQIIRGNRRAYDISVIGDTSLLPQIGLTDGRVLEQRFSRDFPGLWDYIPPPEPLGFMKKFQHALSTK